MKATLTYRVPYADTDQMGVVYYANYLVMFERARNELMRQSGYTYKRFEEEGFMLPVVHAELDYKRRARYDDILEIEAECGALKGVRLEINCTVRRDGEVLVRGFTRHAVVSAETRRPIPPPDELKKIWMQS